MDFRQVLGTSNRRRLELIELLYYNRQGVSSDVVLNELDCSLPILLNDINLINEINADFIVEKDKGLHRVKLKDGISIGKLYAEALDHSLEFKIVEQLLYESSDNIEGLSKILYLSFSNTQRYLKKIENDLKRIDIRLRYRPLRLEGKESVIRHFYYRYFVEKQYTLKIVLPELSENHLKAIKNFVMEFIKINHMQKRHILQKRVAYNLFISLWRIKNEHYYPEEELRVSPLLLPKGSVTDELSYMITEVFQLSLSDKLLRDCLWLSFSDSIIFNEEHRQAALKDNPRYRRLFNRHLELAEEFTNLLGGAFNDERKIELATVLVNETYLHNENGDFISILRKNRTTFLEMVKIMHQHAVEKVTNIVQSFVEKYSMYQTQDFITNYVYLLLTEEEQSLELLASQEKTHHLLLVSDLTPTEEKFISRVISQIVYGNFKIHHLEDIWDSHEEMVKKILSYDGLITTGPREGIPKDFPFVSMDPYVTPQAIVAIQNLINDLSEKKPRPFPGK
ncbi:helix-turn-helix domain-containing protein [Enterococcus avium]|uniref:Helix-turn-helix domain-containing protein n=1 Tax=Enterococcus avium TaxID=33945 RepID=A0ABD5F762_ENTAV|nr:helix-turn-helix domain-containing protein [Enterococcus avium]MDT2397076.1 helix-turn-helix domain-containing protein [Enterococcus avium]MDT2434964.1 helix-turn-helix domain-containing protein [Enterococcus avium]MDT2449529.1 helix-turn-helix domain-containing protein [Enterococcus avium]MDT2465339.1 helix-turn-helix domain-containing protein [Enterococcus avium]MDT2469529.1 helix-turn-helix domain-containing protein [Enterococcus avium]